MQHDWCRSIIEESEVRLRFKRTDDATNPERLVDSPFVPVGGVQPRRRNPQQPNSVAGMDASRCRPRIDEKRNWQPIDIEFWQVHAYYEMGMW